MIFELSECEAIIGYKFRDIELFRQCFTHASYTNEHPGEKNNERLEFFGDKILDFVVTEYLFNSYPDEDEGKLTERRKNLVSKEPLTEVIFGLGLDGHINLGKSLAGNKDKNEKFFSSLYEALVAGIYIDGGLNEAEKFIYRTVLKNSKQQGFVSKQNKKADKKYENSLSELNKAASKENKKTEKKSEALTLNAVSKDPKTELQEYVQKFKLGEIKYEQSGKTGPDNSPEFTEAVTINGKTVASGKGKSKKAAQKEAAASALKILLKNGKKEAEQAKKPLKKYKKVAAKAN